MQLVVRLPPETCSGRDVEVRLNEAIDTAMSAGRGTERRALVTRHSPAHFTVAFTAQVLYGWVREQDET
ncbi:hypothetical protein FJ661_10315 [Pseudarthrobacter phenanthrenivorans]|uniref:hypothetical protein n=1 Tax=Pseudarthrobacter phenanthrenivorans TaxID=361575 RepID=UPI0011298C2B|nr:hypothetical protein [Pseudarthrobacter phenanthrenivorans]TPV51142.1 hypothetical protein FJ661_10315 [Pseudarthrobacter phenanthrenivorans]